jgi:outer membrane protein assembly factor BamB
MKQIFFFAGLGVTLATVAFGVENKDWAGWRGPTGCGITTEKGLPTKWSATEGVLWKTDLPKANNPYSSPIVSRDKVFLTTATSATDQKILCFDAKTGKQLWETAIEAGPVTAVHGSGGFVCSTPCADGERVYAAFGSCVMAAVDFSGKLVWRKPLELKGTFGFGLSVSPILYKETVLLVCDIGGQKTPTNMVAALMAFDRKTGNLKYNEPRPADGVGYATGTFTSPFLVTSGKAPLLIVGGCYQLQGINPDTGKVVWFAEMRHSEYSSSPVCGGGMIFDNGACLPLEGAAGDRTKELKPAPCGSRLSTPVIFDGRLFSGNNETIACLDLATLKADYNMEKNPGLSWGSPVATADGFIYFASGGKSYVVKAGPKFELVATNDLGDGNQASPAIASGKLFIRGATKLWCIGK